MEPSSQHWMEAQVARLHGLAERHVTRARRAREATTRPEGPLAEEKAAYFDFVHAVNEVVDEVSRRPGVTAAFACHEGLLLQAKGRQADFEALAAMTQACTQASDRAAGVLSLGGVQQLVIVGQSHKLALFVIGPLSLGVLSPVAVSLASTLAR
jgi:predicted regulator of Ras-like GTPase activity (Roadblock/LC7/MglB family)